MGGVTFKIPGPKVDPEKDTIAPGSSVRAIFEVTAGVIPGEAMSRYTRRWVLTSEAYHKDLDDTKDVRGMSDDDFAKWVAAGNKVETTFVKYRDAAYDYGKSLIHPAYVNWVRVEFYWM